MTTSIETADSGGGSEQAMTDILDFIRVRKPELGAIDDDVDLIDERIVDSLDFAELLFVIEESTGKPIDLSKVDVEDFRSLRSIRRAFL